MPVRLLDHAALFLCLMGAVLRVNAQVVVDSSFGSGGALNGPNFQIPDNLGKTVGDNLFHSFAEFSLQSGQSATFTGPDSIQNILGRVTGSKVSEIDGLIKSEITGANLYLLNPKGFLFGENAKVDVDGAFTVSARESIRLGEEGSFNAVNPDQSVFVSAAPEAFGFLGGNPGGDITFDGTKLHTIKKTGGIGVSAGGIDLKNGALLSNQDGASIRLEGTNIIIGSGSGLSADTYNQDSGGEILLESSVIKMEESRLSSSTYYGGEVGEGGKGGEGGSIRIKGDKVEVGKYGEVLVETLGSGDGGELKVEAGEFVVSGKGARVSGQSGYRHGSDEWESHERASGRGGSLNIEAGKAEVSRFAVMSVQSTGEGEGGSLRLKARDGLEMSGLRPLISADTYESQGGSNRDGVGRIEGRQNGYNRQQYERQRKGWEHTDYRIGG